MLARYQVTLDDDSDDDFVDAPVIHRLPSTSYAALRNGNSSSRPGSRQGARAEGSSPATLASTASSKQRIPIGRPAKLLEPAKPATRRERVLAYSEHTLRMKSSTSSPGPAPSGIIRPGCSARENTTDKSQENVRPCSVPITSASAEPTFELLSKGPRPPAATTSAVNPSTAAPRPAPGQRCDSVLSINDDARNTSCARVPDSASLPEMIVRPLDHALYEDAPYLPTLQRENRAAAERRRKAAMEVDDDLQTALALSASLAPACETPTLQLDWKTGTLTYPGAPKPQPKRAGGRSRPPQMTLSNTPVLPVDRAKEQAQVAAVESLFSFGDSASSASDATPSARPARNDRASHRLSATQLAGSDLECRLWRKCSPHLRDRAPWITNSVVRISSSSEDSGGEARTQVPNQTEQPGPAVSSVEARPCATSSVAPLLQEASTRPAAAKNVAKRQFIDESPLLVLLDAKANAPGAMRLDRELVKRKRTEVLSKLNALWDETVGWLDQLDSGAEPYTNDPTLTLDSFACNQGRPALPGPSSERLDRPSTMYRGASQTLQSAPQPSTSGTARRPPAPESDPLLQAMQARMESVPESREQPQPPIAYVPEELGQMRLVQLKQIAKAAGLKTSGKRDELIERLKAIHIGSDQPGSHSAGSAHANGVAASLPSVEETIRRLIRADRVIYRRILTYEPVDIDDLLRLIAGARIKFSKPSLISFLDSEGICHYSSSSDGRWKR